MPRTLALLSLAAAAGMSAPSLSAAADIDLMHFLADCPPAEDVTGDPAQAEGECGVLLSLIDRFNVTNSGGHRVTARFVPEDAYLGRLAATFELEDIPDLALVRAAALPNLATRDRLTLLEEPLSQAGVDLDDLLPAARANATVQDGLLGLPYDLRPLLVLANRDLMETAGLLEEDGSLSLPTDPEAFLETARSFEDATGHNFFAVGGRRPGEVLPRLFLSLLRQAGAAPLEPGGTALNAPEAVEVATFLRDLRSIGPTPSHAEGPEAAQAFLSGEAGLLITDGWPLAPSPPAAANGDLPFEILPAPLPGLFGQSSALADSLVWTVPADPSRAPEETQAVVTFLGFLGDSAADWMLTGHLPATQSVLDGGEFSARPQAAALRDALESAQPVPQIRNHGSVMDAIAESLALTWQEDLDPEAALAAAEDRVNTILGRDG